MARPGVIARRGSWSWRVHSPRKPRGRPPRLVFARPPPGSDQGTNCSSGSSHRHFQIPTRPWPVAACAGRCRSGRFHPGNVRNSGNKSGRLRSTSPTVDLIPAQGSFVPGRGPSIHEGRQRGRRIGTWRVAKKIGLNPMLNVMAASPKSLSAWLDLSLSHSGRMIGVQDDLHREAIFCPPLTTMLVGLDMKRSRGCMRSRLGKIDPPLTRGLPCGSE